VPVCGRALEILAEQAKARKSDFVFDSPRGRPLSGDSSHDDFAVTAENAPAYFNGAGNVGAVMGHGDLADSDLDCLERSARHPSCFPIRPCSGISPSHARITFIAAPAWLKPRQLQRASGRTQRLAAAL
jgi:hypothetical protein